MSKKVLTTFQIVDAQSMGADVTSTGVNCQFLDNIAVQAVYTGSPVGVLSVQGSIDNSNFVNILSVNISAADTTIFDLNQMSVPYIRVFFDRTSGTGTLNAKISAKEI